MRFSTALLVALCANAASARFFGSIPNPQHLSTEQLRSLVEQNYDSASNALTDNDIANWFKSNSLVPSPTSKSRSRALDTIRRSYGGKATSYTSWDSADLSGWLEARSIAVAGKLTTQDHGLKPKPKSTREELLDQVQANWESARTYVADAGRAAQTPFANAANAVSDTWTESQLREYLLKQGVIAPKGTVEELRILAKQHGSGATASVSSAFAKATDVVSDGLYAAADAPAQAYDYVAGSLDAARDYVYSSWDDNAVRDYAVQHGYIKSASQAKRDEVIKAISDNTPDVYGIWSDSRLRSWLQSHGVVKGKTATTRDELLDLVSRNYYGARDTTYHTWNDNTIKRWLQSRGIIKSDAQVTADEARSKIAEAYYGARDSVVDAWDDSYVKHYAQKAGLVEPDAKYTAAELRKTVKDNYSDANDYVWSTWSDAKQRAYLVKEGVLDQAKAADLKRHELEDYLTKNYARSSSNWDTDSMRNYLKQKGLIKSDAEANAAQIKELFTSNYDAASSKSNAYLTWSDKRLRSWLRDNGIKVAPHSNREELVRLMRGNYVSSQGLGGLLSTIQGWMSSGVDIAEDNIAAAVAMLGAAVGAGRGTAEEAGLKAKYGALSASSVASSYSGTDAPKTASSASKSVFSAYSHASSSISSAGSSLLSSASSYAASASKSAASAAASYSSSASSAASVASASATSAASVASKSASSAANKASNANASKSATSLASVGSASASSAAASASSSASSLAASYSKSASSYGASLSSSLSSYSSSVSSSMSSAAVSASSSASSYASRLSSSASSASVSASKAARKEL